VAVRVSPFTLFEGRVITAIDGCIARTSQFRSRWL
jgi:hypothetical protein